jgi:hypothetical protein
VSLDYAWWFPEKGATDLYGWADVNVNILTDDDPPFSHEMDMSNLRGILCKVSDGCFHGNGMISVSPAADTKALASDS